MSFDIVGLHEWASKNGHEIVFTILMEPIDNRNRPPLQNYDNVPCVITQTRYKVSDNHKITLRPIVPGYREETFYIADIKSLMRQHPTLYTMTVMYRSEIVGIMRENGVLDGVGSKSFA